MYDAAIGSAADGLDRLVVGPSSSAAPSDASDVWGCADAHEATERRPRSRSPRPHDAGGGGGGPLHQPSSGGGLSGGLGGGRGCSTSCIPTWPMLNMLLHAKFRPNRR